MKINVTENKVSIKEEQILNENEYNIHKIQFDFSSEYTDDLVKVALFSIDNHTYKKIISNNECDIPPEVLTQRGYSILGVYAYKTEQDTLVLRYSPSPTKISVYDGSYKADAENSEPITPSEIEQYQQILQNSLQQFQNQYNALVEETEGDIQAIEDELQRKVDEGYFDGEDGFSPIAKVIQKSNGATIEIEDKNGKTTADVLNGQDGYSPIRGIDYWTEEDKQQVEEEATQQIEGKIEEYNDNAAEKLSQYNQNSVQKTNNYNTNAEQKMSAYNTNATEKTSTYNSNATEKFNDYNSNAEQKETNYNTNASQKVESFNTNASSKLSEYNSNAETKKSTYDENATQKTNSFNTNATNKLTEYNTNHTEKMSAYNSNSTEKLNAFNENAVQKTEDFDEHTEQIQTDIEVLQRTDDEILSNFNKFDEVTGEDITLNETTEIKFAKPPLPMGNSEQVTNLSDGKIEQGALSEGTPVTANDRIRTVNFIEVKEDTEISVNATSSKTIQVLYAFYDNSKAFISNSGWNNTGTNIAIINTAKYIKVTIKNSDGTNISPNDVSNFVVGNIPNPDYPQEITNVTGDVEVKVQNKNLFDKNNVIDGYRLGSDGTNFANPGYSVTDFIKVKPSTNFYRNRAITIMEAVCLYDKDKNFISRLQNGNAFTTTENTYYIKTDVENTYLNTTQLELGSTATPYTPHKEQVLPLTLGNIELCKIEDYQDYFYKESNKWYLHKEFAKLVIDENSNVGVSVSQNYSTCYYGVQLDVAKTTNESIGYSNYFKFDYSNSIGKTYFTASKYLYFIMDGSITNATTLKNWLSTHNVLVYYPLATPTDTEITDTTLISQLEAINNAISYEEQTNISGSSDGSNPIFTVQAYKSLNKELNNKLDESDLTDYVKNTDYATSSKGGVIKANSFYATYCGSDGFLQATQKNYSEYLSLHNASFIGKGTLENVIEGKELINQTQLEESQEIQDEEIEKLQTENARLKATLPTTTGTGQTITLNKTAEFEFIKPPLPMGNSEQGILPEQYQQVEYIESTGTQYINTNYTPVENDDINIEKVKNTGTGCLFSAGNSTNQLILLASSSTNYYWKYFATGNATAFFTEELSNFSTISIANGSISINNVVKASSTYAGTVDTTIQLFRRVNGESYATASIGRFTITNGNKTKLDLIPCYRISDNEVGMYDLVSNTFYTNAGTGTFNKGNSTPNPNYEQPITNVTGDVEVVVENKNLFDGELELGSINPGNGELQPSTWRTRSKNFMKVKPNTTYTVSVQTGQYRWIIGYTADKIGITDGNASGQPSAISTFSLSTEKTNTFTTTATTEYIKWYDTSSTDLTEKVQIEKGSTATPYTPHKEQVLPLTLGNIELCKIEDYQDYFYKESNKWYLHKEFAKLVIDENSNVGVSVSQNYSTCYYGVQLDVAKTTNESIGYSNYFKFDYSNSIGKTYFTASKYLYFIMDGSITNATTLKNWLSTHNVLVYYPLATPTDTEITDTTLISQLEAINNAISYEEQTTISSNTIALFSVEAYQSTKLVLEEMATAIVALGGV